MAGLKKVLVGTAVMLAILSMCTGFVNAAATVRTGIISGSVVNLRKSPSTSSTVLAKISKSTHVSVTGQTSKWYKVSYSGKSGWISRDLINIKTSTAYVTTDILNLRSKASTSSKILTKLSKNVKITILSHTSGWDKVKASNGKIGWVSNKYVSTKKTSRGGSSSVAQSIIDYAKRFIGSNYSYGGSSPSGFDCSGFSQYVFNHYNINLERTADSQAGQGAYVSKSDLIAGDLVFFDTNGGHNSINHVGVYIGGGRFIHSSNYRYGVIVTDLSDAYYANSYMTARRIIK